MASTVFPKMMPAFLDTFLLFIEILTTKSCSIALGRSVRYGIFLDFSRCQFGLFGLAKRLDHMDSIRVELQT